jgi:hypothetical protein
MNNNLNPVFPNVSNENILLIDILNNMYNDNLTQINNFINSINNLNETNSQIRNIFVQILYNQTRRRNNNTYNINRASRFFNLRENNANAITDTSAISDANAINNTTARLARVIFDNPPNQNNRYSFFPSTNGQINANLTQLYDSFFQPIEVYPTQTQIEAATRRVRYSDIISPKNRSCPILMEDFNDNDMVSIIRHCGHIFNTNELNRWFSSNCKCPVCRYDIRNYNSNASSEFFNNGAQTAVSINSNDSTLNNNNQSSSSANDEERRNNTAIDDLNDSLIDNFINLYNMTDISGNVNNNTTRNPSYLFRLLRRY